jgi:hypothetical protein
MIIYVIYGTYGRWFKMKLVQPYPFHIINDLINHYYEVTSSDGYAIFFDLACGYVLTWNLGSTYD